MSMHTDLQAVIKARSRKCEFELLHSRNTDPDILRSTKTQIDKFAKQEEDLSVKFLRTYAKDIERMMDRERRIRRLVKEFSPQ